MNTREPTGALNPGDSIEGQMLSVTIPKSFSSCAPRWISAEMPELFIGPLAAAQNRRLAHGRQAHARNAGFCGRGGALPAQHFCRSGTARALDASAARPSAMQIAYADRRPMAGLRDFASRWRDLAFRHPDGKWKVRAHQICCSVTKTPRLAGQRHAVLSTR